jgi:hypothetical protein
MEGGQRQHTGIAQKVADLSERIENIEAQISEKETEKNSIHTDGIDDKDEKNRLLEQKDQVREELEQQRQLVQLERQLVQLERQLKQLLVAFGNGEYYGFTDAYWEIKEITRVGNEWQSFVRDFGDNEHFSCRYGKGANANIITTDPYEITRAGALEMNYDIPTSETARNSSIPQSDQTCRDAVWPTDVFGNEAMGQDVAHLIPAGKVAHKEWLNVACAALGIGISVPIEVKKKAARGYIQDDNITRKRKRKSEQQGVETSAQDASNLSDTSSKKRTSRKAGTGVVHFVANKIRLQNQRSSFDGSKPTCLIVPVMTLDDARSWRGQGYTAVCFAGMPYQNSFSCMNKGLLYQVIGLTFLPLTSFERTRDAEQGEVEMARQFLERAVIALCDMIAHLSDEELNLIPSGNLRKARNDANEMICKVPRPRSPSESGRKPACLVTFGDATDTELHPAPDPLLLVLRAANSFGIMAGMKMLASAEPDDSDVSTGDIMEEEAFLEAREQSWRPNTWADLAKGLGQPNGYFASIGKVAYK